MDAIVASDPLGPSREALFVFVPRIGRSSLCLTQVVQTRSLHDVNSSAGSGKLLA
jgi:hypothetical protein